MNYSAAGVSATTVVSQHETVVESQAAQFSSHSPQQDSDASSQHDSVASASDAFFDALLPHADTATNTAATAKIESIFFILVGYITVILWAQKYTFSNK